MTFGIQNEVSDYYQPARPVPATGLSAAYMERVEVTQMRERLLGHRPQQLKTRSAADFLKKRHPSAAQA